MDSFFYTSETEEILYRQNLIELVAEIEESLMDDPELELDELEKKESNIIYMDVETTGLCPEDEIINLTAVNYGLGEFNQYIMPNVPIKKGSAKNGFRVENNKLFKDGIKMETVDRKDFLEAFLVFLKKRERPVVLLAHNGKYIAFPKLIREIERANMTKQFKKVIKGFCDSYSFLKAELPAYDYDTKKKMSFKIPDLYKAYVKTDYKFDDRQISKLHAIFLEWSFADSYIEKKSRSFDEEVKAYHESMATLQKKKALFEILKRDARRHKFIVTEKFLSLGIDAAYLEEKHKKEDFGAFMKWLESLFDWTSLRKTDDFALENVSCDISNYFTQN